MASYHDCIVIGGGPAGMTAALNILRGGKSCLIIEREAFGGQIATSPRVENIPSIKSITGLDFANNLFDQISDLGVDFELEEVEEVSKDGDIFTIKTNYGEHTSKTVIIAAGVVHRKTGLPREEELTGHGISYCATCDGAFFKGKDICLIGDANTAIQYAIILSNFCTHVHVYALFDKLFADDILQKVLYSKENVDVTFNMSLQEFIGSPELTGLRFKNTKTNEESTIQTSGVFIAIGQIPDNKRYEKLVELSKQGFIITNSRQETKTAGLYAVGDCTDKEIRQVQTACSDGAIAAAHALKYLG